ncbi:MAG TPA: hypothetical protein VF310_12320 [Vicinamibacteria bacterium]
MSAGRGGRGRAPRGPRRRAEPAPGTYHHSERAGALLRDALDRHGCATARALAAKLGLSYGPGLLVAIGYRGDAAAAWRDLAPGLEEPPDEPGR